MRRCLQKLGARRCRLVPWRTVCRLLGVPDPARVVSAALLRSLAARLMAARLVPLRLALVLVPALLRLVVLLLGVPSNGGGQ